MKSFVMDLVEFWKTYWSMVAEFYRKHWRGTIVMVIVIYGIAAVSCAGGYLIHYIKRNKKLRELEESEED